VKARLLIVCGTSLSVLIFAKGTLADGTYQRTDDRKKTLVWNNDPKPEDAVSWSGDKDRDGYATGPGTLTWFRVDRKPMTGSNIFGNTKTPISNYTGTMVHGKLSGSVTTVDHGKTYHATFADGRKKGSWMAGSLITKAESAEPTVTAEKPERAEPATANQITSETESTEKISGKKSQARVAEEKTADVPAAGPGEEEEVSGQKSKITKPAAANEENAGPAQKISQPRVAQASSEEPDQSATPREPVTRKAALAPGAVRPIDRPTRTVTKKSETEPTVQSERAKPERIEKAKTVAKPASSQPPEADTQLSEDIPAEGPAAETKEENVQRSTTASPVESSPRRTRTNAQQSSVESSQPSAKESPVDDSIRTLTGPPSSLHVNAPPPPETNPPTQIPTPSTAAASPPPAPAGPKLTAVNAMDIADIEARTKGYDLGEYQLPKAEYNSTTDTWSVTYIPRDADSTAKKLNVTIQDKNGKAEVKK